MNFRDSRAAVWVIWGMVVAFAIIQAVAWTLAGGIPRRPGVLVQVIAAWIIMLTLAAFSTMRLGGLSRRLAVKERDHRATLDEIEELQTRNEILSIVARSVDVPLAFQALARRIVRLVPCDRVGLALLSENGEDFQTYTARTDSEERRVRPRPEIVFKMDRTAIGDVVRSQAPMLIPDARVIAGDYLDVNVLHTAGFRSALIVPLVAKGRAAGTLNVVSRTPDAFTATHTAALVPIAELFAIAYVAQQLQMALGKYSTMEAMSELTLSVSAEMNSALQTIIGHCDLIERGYPNPDLHRDLSTIVRQAQRIDTLLEKMRLAAHERMKEVEASGVVPSSPEALGGAEQV
jgi:transcriptional regulator with GAF, ATPase, and Fis domain